MSPGRRRSAEKVKRLWPTRLTESQTTPPTLSPSRYHGPVSLLDVSPSFGPADGGTRVTVRGTGLHNWPSLSCRFDSDVVPARWLNANHIECSAPAHAPGRVAMSVSLNGEKFAPSGTSGLTFTYELNTRVRFADPTTGPLEGGTDVLVHGNGFSNTTGLACRFGTERAALATFINSTLVACQTPRVALTRRAASSGGVNGAAGEESKAEQGTTTYGSEGELSHEGESQAGLLGSGAVVRTPARFSPTLHHLTINQAC